MLKSRRYAKVNVKVLVILILIVSAVIVSLFAARQIRRNILSRISLEAGEKAFEEKDWVNAYKNFQEYLGRNPDNIEILKKYAQARLSVRPLEIGAIAGCITAYRTVLQLNNKDPEVYDKLALLYRSVGNYDELAYIARMRLENEPEDMNAPLWLSAALMQMNKLNEAQETLQTFIKKIETLSGKHSEYVQACLQMSDCMIKGNATDAAAKALEWIDKALEYDPESVEALLNRAKFYCDRNSAAGVGPVDKLELAAARKDLELADKLGTENPKLRFLAGAQWLVLGEYDKASAEIQAVDNLSQETIEKYFLDIQDIKVVRFLLASEIAMRQGNIQEAISLIEESLKNLTEERYRIQILPVAIRIYAMIGKVTDVRKCYDEYLQIMSKQGENQSSNYRNAYLQALVARVEGKPYLVIDTLRPVIVNNASVVELWQLLADAYNQTGQPRLASAAVMNVLNKYPNIYEMVLLLAKSNFAMGQWNKAFEAAAKAESLRPKDVIAKLLRIESGIRMAIENISNPDKESLEKFSKELADFRLEYPDLVNIRILQASVENYLGQPDKVENELKKAIADCNDSLDAEIQLAGFYVRNKRVEDAVKVCETACKNHPDSSSSWLSLADAYTASENYEQARSSLNQGLKAVTAKDDKHSISIRLALLEILHGDREAGKQLLRNIAKENEQELQARLLLLEIREVQQDSEEAEKLIKEIEQIEGKSGLWWRLYQARLWLLSDQWRSKEQDISNMLQICISADPGNSTPVLLLVELYKKLGDQRRMENVCRQALAINPLASDVANELLLLLESQKRFSDAEQVLKQTDMNQRASNLWQVRMAINTGDISRAIDELKLQISNDKNNAASRIQLARLIYQQTKDSVQAFKYLDDANAITHKYSEDANSITPDSINITSTRAAILKAEGRQEDAIKVINDYVEDHNDFSAYWMRAQYLLAMGDVNNAEKDYLKLTTFEKNSAAGYELLSNFYAKTKQIDKAISKIEESLIKNPENLSLERTLMKLFVIQGPTRNIEKANGILKKLEAKFPNDSDLAKFKAALLIENPSPQSFETARGLLESVIKQEPGNVDVYLMLISMAVKEKKYDAARNYAVQGLGANSNNQTLMIARSRIELDAGNYKMAGDLANIMLQKNPENTEVRDLFIRGALGSRDKNLLKEAGMRVESALASNPKDEKLLITQTNILIAQDQAKNAISALEVYCQTEPGKGSIPALVTLAEVYRITADLTKAEQKINQAADIEPNNLSVIHSRLLILVAQKKYEEISQISSSYLSIKNPNPQVLLEAAAILLSLDSQKLKEEGLKVADRAAALSPASVDAGFVLASALYNMGNKDLAEEKYKVLFEKFPNDVRVLNDYAWILQESHQDYAKALELADKGLKLASDDLHLLDTRATILSKMPDKLNEARKDFEKLVGLYPAGSKQQAKTLLKLGRLCVKLNDSAGAKIYLQNALDIDKKSEVFTPAERQEISEILK